MTARVEVVQYDPAWEAEFNSEAERIRNALGDGVERLHHIGSTAIPGMFAKPIIDFLMEVQDVALLDRRASAMEGLGYEAMGEFGIPGRRYFRKDNPSGVRTHHVHAFGKDSAEIERHIAFRDYMIAHVAEAAVYGELKRRLARKHPNDIEAYMDGKDAFIKEHEAKAVLWRSARTSKPDGHFGTDQGRVRNKSVRFPPKSSVHFWKSLSGCFVRRYGAGLWREAVREGGADFPHK